MLRVPLVTAALAALVAAAPAWAQEVTALALGTFEHAVTSNGILVTSPHGTADENTAPLAVTIAQQLGAGHVVARGFMPGIRINVNRPTEGAGRACDREIPTERARQVYAEFQRLVAVAAGPTPLRLYVEIHGNSRPASQAHIEVATKGITVLEAEGAKAVYPTLLARVGTEWMSYPALQLLIEPPDHLTWRATCSKRIGVLGTAAIERALHFEFPRAARDEPVLPATARLAVAIIERIQGR